MLHICKDTYLQAVKKCYILYKSTTLRKSEIRGKTLQKSRKRKNSRILSLVIPPTNPLDFLNVEKQKEVIKNGIKQTIITKIQNKHPYFLLNLIFFYIFAIDSLGQVMMKKSIGTI